MKSNTFRRLLCGAVAAVMLFPAVMAEGLNSDDVSGTNPFTGEYIPPSAAPVLGQAAADVNTNNPFGGADLTVPAGTGAGGAVTADDLFGGNTSYTVDPNSNLAAVANDPFATGTASATPSQPVGGASAATNDPFGTGEATLVTNDPFGTGSATNTASDPFGTGAASDAADVSPSEDAAPAAAGDPFGAGAAAAQTEAGTATGGNPFGEVVPQATAAPTQMPTVKGYNPFASSADASTMTATQPGTVMYVSNSIARLRQQPSDEAKVITAVYFGAQLNVTATQDEWAQVTNPANGRTLYCLLEGLSTTDPNTMSKLMYAQLPTTPISKSPTNRAIRLRNVKKGDTVTMTAITDDGMWARVTVDGTNYGFVPTIDLDDAPAAEGTQGWCGSAYTGVMVNPDRWTKIGNLSFGQPCYLVGYISNNTIAKIRSAKGYVAYCDASALVTADPATQATPVYAQITGKVLGKTAGDEAENYFNVKKNSQLMLLGIDSTGTWALVRRGKQKLYIPALYLGTTRLGNEKRNLVVIQDTPLYSNSLPGSPSLGTLPLGTRMQLVGGTSTHAEVATVSDGFSEPVTGYVPFEYLRAE